MRLRSPRLAAVALLATLALLTPTSPAVAAIARPAQVGLVSFTGASLTPTGATLTVDWPDAAGAAGYEVFAARSLDAVAAATTPAVRVTDSKATVSRLTAGVDYFVQVRAVNSAGVGPRSSRVGHGTIASQGTFPAGAPSYRALTWNVCSNACAGITTRAKVINRRITEIAPDIVALQEASKYITAPTGYRFVANGQNDILVRSGQFSVVPKKTAATAGSTVFARKSATPGKGIAWAALRHRTGAYVVVFDAHLVSGTTAAQVAQRTYEAERLNAFVLSTLGKLAASYGSLTNWKNAPVIILGDFNTHKSRVGDGTQAVLQKAGWYDAYDQARALMAQHHNSANPTMQTAPVIGVRWGDHVDKVLVRPSRTAVIRWANAGKRVDGTYVAPLGSDHHPVLAVVSVR